MKFFIMLLKPLLISCRQAAELMSSSLDTRPDLLTRLKIALHGYLCLPCEYLRKQFIFIDTLLQHRHGEHKTHDITLPHEIKDIIKKKLVDNNTI